jgi:hypothetical protein
LQLLVLEAQQLLVKQQLKGMRTLLHYYKMLMVV